MTNDHTNISDLTAALYTKPDLPLKFYLDGAAINPGYHITEIRHAAINSLDCGRNSDSEQWNEVTIQLLDGSAQSSEGHMSGSKFLAIVGTAVKSLSIDTAPYLFFEFALGNGPLRKLNIESIERTKDEISVSLGSETAVCKPFQRMADANTAKSLSGIGALVADEACCSGGSTQAAKSCCG
uniref:Uncharacterized protein n=1 Tax=uncultured Thiotrichaceae bacterium TaxID=298394 RepID=A0A6S6TYQ0_9GAMM|nr:MAG: Unknown protein [uncultured Thiotrichaceae bacterium]